MGRGGDVEPVGKDPVGESAELQIELTELRAVKGGGHRALGGLGERMGHLHRLGACSAARA